MEFFKKFTYKRFWVYLFRWLTSGLVIAPITSLALLFGLPVWVGVSLGNACGAALYWHFDLFLLCDKPNKYRFLNWIKAKLK